MKRFWLLSLILFFSASFISPSVEKKVKKELEKHFGSKQIVTWPMAINDKQCNELNLEFRNKNFRQIKKEEKLLGYLYIGRGNSRTDVYDYMVILDVDLYIEKVKILIYRESYGNEIASRRWLGQFDGKNASIDLEYGKNISAISGATISGKSLVWNMQNLNRDLLYLLSKKQIP